MSELVCIQSVVWDGSEWRTYCVKQLNGTLHSKVYLKICLPMCNYTPQPTALFENTSCLYHLHFQSPQCRIREVIERRLITYMIWLPQCIIHSYSTRANFHVSSWCICTFDFWSNIYVQTLGEFHNSSIAIYWVLYHYLTHIRILLRPSYYGEQPVTLYA